MAYDINVWTFTGNVGSDPDSRFLQDGTQVTSFSVGVGTGKDKTTWARCSVFGKQAELAQSGLNKGDAVTISGSLDLREYTANDGKIRASLDVRVNNFKLPRKGTQPDAANDSGSW